MAALGTATAGGGREAQPLQIESNCTNGYFQLTVSGFTDPSFFPFFTVFAFAMFLNLLRIFPFYCCLHRCQCNQRAKLPAGCPR
jgi:hypothetical protein